MFTSLHTFAAEQSATNGGAYGLVGILPWVIVLVALYFIMIRPQRKKEKETIRMRSNIQIGDEILTIGGIETGGDRSKLRIRIEAVQENLTAQEEAAKEKKEKQNAKLTPGAPKKEKSKKEKSESEE